MIQPTLIGRPQSFWQMAFFQLHDQIVGTPQQMKRTDPQERWDICTFQKVTGILLRGNNYFPGPAGSTHGSIQLREEFRPCWNRLNYIMNRRKRMNWSFHIIVQFGIVRDQSHFDPIRFRYKESRIAPLSWSGFFSNDLRGDKIIQHLGYGLLILNRYLAWSSNAIWDCIISEFDSHHRNSPLSMYLKTLLGIHPQLDP